MYWSEILWYLSWPALIYANYLIVSFVLKKHDPVQEEQIS